MYFAKTAARQRHGRLAAALMAAGLASFSALAAPAPDTSDDLRQEQARAERKERNPKVAKIEDLYRGGHHQKRALDASERKPSVAPSTNAYLKYGDDPGQQADSRALVRPSKELARGVTGVSANAALAACDTALFAGASGTALVNAVKSSTSDCINTLFGVTGTTAGAIFSESKMVTIANAFASAAASYDGTNGASTLQMVMFLRAGYYVNYYDGASTGPYGATLKAAIRTALDAFVNNRNFGLVNDAHGETLAEFVTLVDSASENARYLNSVVKRLLDGFNASAAGSWWMTSATNNAFTVLFRGHQNADFQALVKADASIVDTLHNFANAHFDLLGTDDGYLVANAGRELGRFLQYADNTAPKVLARSRAKTLVERSSITGASAALWVGLGEQVDYYDKANCAYYNMCNFSTRLATEVLPISHSCSPTLRLRAQALTRAQLNEACTIVGGQESYFHKAVASGAVPVANDNNAQLEMVVFASSQDYGTYAGAIYGIDTNNGGMYLEGNPSAAGNQPRFIAYQAEWLLPKFEIWNLTHEYIHYLDGRFDMYGDFNAAMSVNSVWWVEGFAEYMSYGYRNLSYDAAKAQAAAGTYALSTIFRNDYNSGQTRVYNWGYLAVRYLFEKQRAKVSNVLGYFRPGNYTGYAAYMTGAGMGSSMDADFRNWLPCVNNAALPQCAGGTANAAPVADFTATVAGLTAKFTSTATDSDGSVAGWAWNFGDGTTSTAANPAKTYAAAGTYTVKLTVTDDKGAKSAVKSRAVTVSGGATLPECPGSAQQLGRNCVRSNLSATAGNYAYMYLLVPAGTKQIRLTSSGGTGNADMYANTLGQWATRNAYNYGSFNGGNGESIVVNYPPAGYMYISLYGQAAFAGAQLKVEF
ncbi:collagenase [Pseudoduganella chitinolytica]|uniref:microbial collagenase n=1 Tax=Pseudoduganella chitinolytica TaxID=34070 RepID=A0ABY8B7U2_9BURK|nr:collagenase [Pseudoduganella chitinolytica]WEF30817.1 collagenase [Pseudoduganella chitinolytica]